MTWTIYRRRERTARQQALSAVDPSIAAIYTKMADRYADLIVAQESDRARNRESLKLKLVE